MLALMKGCFYLWIYQRDKWRREKKKKKKAKIARTKSQVGTLDEDDKTIELLKKATLFEEVEVENEKAVMD